MTRWIAIGVLVVTLGVGAMGAGTWMLASWAAPVVASGVARGLDVARTQVPHLLPAGLSHGDVEALLDDAARALRDGRVDGQALVDLAWWLPLAFLDGGLDAGEAVALHDRLARVVSRTAPPDVAAPS